MVELIILDLYGTIVKADQVDNEIRKGFMEFLEYYSPNHIISISTDGPPAIVSSTLEMIGLENRFDGVYDERHCFYNGNKTIKNLGRILYDSGISPKNAIFIGDNHLGRDESSAKEFEVDFLRVPQFREKLPPYSIRLSNESWVIYDDRDYPFSFKSLIGKI